MKKFHKILAGIFCIGMAAASSLYATDPSTGQAFDPNNYGVTPISVNGQLIHFSCSDNNTGETIIFKSDKCSYDTIGEEDVYFSGTNISPDDQNYPIQILDNNGISIDNIEEYLPEVPYQVDVPDYADSKTCRTVKNPYGKDFDQCGYQIGTHQETQYKDGWGTINKDAPDINLSKDAIKPVPAQFQPKGQFQYWIPSGVTKYFRAKVKLGEKTHGEFYIFSKGSLGSWGSLDPSWYSNSWGYRMQVTYNYQYIASSTSETYANFAVLASTTSASLKFTGSGGHMGKSDGTDMLFTLADGTTKLNHEIEYYSSTTGAVLAWVNVGTGGLSTSTPNVGYLYYGNAAASDQQNINATWNTNYKTVYHLKNGTTLALTDSTATGKTLTNNATVTATTGQIDGAASFSGSNYLTASDTGLPTGAKTISMWVFPTTFTSSNNMLVYGTGGTQDRLTLWRFSGTGTSLDFAGWADDVSYAHSFSTNTWYNISGTFNGSTVSIYLNGTLVAGPTSATWNTTLGEGLQIGNWATYDAAGKFQGIMDEIRISNIARSADWIMTEYNNQNNPGTFETWGIEEALSLSNSRANIINGSIINGSIN